MSTIIPISKSVRWTAPSQDRFTLCRAESPYIESVFAAESQVGRSGRHCLDTFIPPEQGDLLYSLVRFLRPQRTLEIGMANGISSLYIASGLRDEGVGKHLAIDPHQHTDWDDVGLLSIQRAQLDHLVSLDARMSHHALPDLDEAKARFQFAFIDGCHLMDYVMSDFMMVDRVLDVGGMIAFDDSDWAAVNQVIRFALANRSYEVFQTGTVIEPGPGRPSLAAAMLRGVVRRVRPLQRLFRGDFLYPSVELNIDGRCVVIRKVGDDQRHPLLGQLRVY